MIVCLCHRVSDRDIQVAVKGGTTSFDALQDDLRVGSACGCCQDSARSVFDEACASACACAGRESGRAAAALTH